MFAGHFGLAAGLKAKAPEVPLWALMLGTQLLDVAFVPLFLGGVETIDSPDGEGYGKAIIHADYTHSLVGALLIAVLAAFAAKWRWGKRAGFMVGGIVFSHWLLDFIVHREDMPFLPGNWGDLPLLGLGAWRYEGIAIGLELLLLVVGFAMYVRSSLKRAGSRSYRAVVSSAVLGVLLALSLITDVFGLF